jgi:predicted site-specific integrase-resolvase
MNKIRLTRAQLAARLGKQVNTLAHWATQGRGPAYMVINGRVLYDLETVEAWERERTHQSTAEYDVQPGPIAAQKARLAKREAQPA